MAERRRSERPGVNEARRGRQVRGLPGAVRRVRTPLPPTRTGPSLLSSNRESAYRAEHPLQDRPVRIYAREHANAEQLFPGASARDPTLLGTSSPFRLSALQPRHAGRALRPRPVTCSISAGTPGRPGRSSVEFSSMQPLFRLSVTGRSMISLTQRPRDLIERSRGALSGGPRMPSDAL